MTTPDQRPASPAPKQLILFTAPTAWTFHLALGEELKRHYPEARLTFVTLYSLAAKRLRNACQHEVVYFPDRVRQQPAKQPDTARVVEIDQRLQQVTGANLHLMLTADKTLPKMGRKAETLIQHYALALDDLIGPDTLLVSRMYDCAFLWMAAGITITKGGWPFGFVSNGIPPKSTMALRTPFETWNVPRAETGEALLAYTRDMLKRPPSERTHYMQDASPKKLGPAIRENLLSTWHLWKDRQTKTGVISTRDVFLNARLTVRKRLPRLRPPRMDIRDLAELDTVDEPFVFFPLQYEPEASIFMYSPWFRGQEEAIRLIGQALPVGWKLLVKEHPTMMQLRPSSFYRGLQRIPNLRLVSPAIQATPVIERCRAVCCITGSATFEAKLLGKPAFCLGRPPFNHMLDHGDLAANNIRLEELFAILERGSPDPVSPEDFARYAAGTLDAHGSTFSNGGVWQHDDSPENVAKFSAYIQAAITHPAT